LFLYPTLARWLSLEDENILMWSPVLRFPEVERFACFKALLILIMRWSSVKIVFCRLKALAAFTGTPFLQHLLFNLKH
jgi:hypothetical protein